MKDYGVHHRLSSVAFARSNGRAEVGVKTVKRLLMENTGPNGDLNNDSFQRAMLQYRNTPDRDTRLSPAMCVFGRHIRDFIPVLPHKYRPKGIWSNTLASREEALRKRHMRTQERLSEHTRRLPPLRVGDYVRVQNQIGPYPLKWDRTGIVVEVRQHDQYIVKINGSNRTTLRNRRFLRHFTPIRPDPQPRSLLEDLNFQKLTEKPATETSTQPLPTSQAKIPANQTLLPSLEIPQVTEEPSQSERSVPSSKSQEKEASVTSRPDPTPAINPIDAPPPRRSARASKPPARLNYGQLGNPEHEKKPASTT